MQEVRRLGVGSLYHKGYDVYWTGLKYKKMSGVAIAIRRCKEIIIRSIHHISDRHMAADIC